MKCRAEDVPFFFKQWGGVNKNVNKKKTAESFTVEGGTSFPSCGGCPLEL